MARGISLTRDEQQAAFIQNRGDAFRLRVTAHDNEGMPTEIFVHQLRLMNPYTAETIADFTHIASPFDISIYPVGEPDATQFPAFFRLAVADFLVPGQLSSETAWEAIQEQVCLLVQALNALDVLAEVETIRCGDDLPVESLSESTSEM